MDQAFKEFFKFTDFVWANFWHIVWGFVVLMIVWALLKSLIGSIIGDTADMFRKAFGRSEKKSKEVTIETDGPKPIEEPKPIMVAHPLDIKDEASRRLFEEEVEKEKERMRLRSKTE